MVILFYEEEEGHLREIIPSIKKVYKTYYPFDFEPWYSLKKPDFTEFKPQSCERIEAIVYEVKRDD